MGTLKALKRRPNNKHHNPCWSQHREVEPTIPSNISLRETFDKHEPPRKQLASRRNSESTSKYLRSLLTLGNEGARRYTIAAGKTRPVAPVQVGPHGAEFRGVLVKTFNQARETRPSLPEEGDNGEGNSKREDVQDHISNTIRRRNKTAIPQQRPRIPPYHCVDPYEAKNRSKRRRRNEGIARERRKDQKQG